jgi:hypothetical protein
MNGTFRMMTVEVGLHRVGATVVRHGEHVTTSQTQLAMNRMFVYSDRGLAKICEAPTIPVLPPGAGLLA